MQVSTQKLEDDLSDLWERLRIIGNPRIVIMVTPTSTNDDYIAESKITELLIGKGFNVREADQLPTAQQVKSLRLLCEGNDDAENIMALREVADLVITGKSTARPAETVIYMPSALNVNSAINAKVVRTDTGQIIGAGRAEGLGAGFTTGDALTASLEDAKQKLFDDKYLLRQIIRTVLDPCQTYQLEITGCSYAQMMQIDNELLDMRFIRTAHILSFTNGTATMSVECTGSNKTLANDLQTGTGIPLEVDACTANSLRVHVKAGG